jgi:predicted MFS family arabinose efflux permease
MIGLAVGTALGGFAVGLGTLLFARLLAGVFGGPATSLSLAIIADRVPVERRGRAMGTVMASFSLASILGVPVGLELAQRLGWRAPFFAVAALALLLTGLVARVLRPMRGHLVQPGPSRRLPLRGALPLLSLACTALVMLSIFSVVPNISAFVQHNVGYPRERLGVLYLVGGGISFLASRLIGFLVDRFGATRMLVIGTCLFALAMIFTFIRPVGAEHVIYVFPLMMTSATVRGVPLQTLASRVPKPEARARFMSAQSTVQHLASSVGAGSGALFLDSTPDGRLVGMTTVALIAIAIALWVPPATGLLERGLRRRDLASPAS